MAQSLLTYFHVHDRRCCLLLARLATRAVARAGAAIALCAVAASASSAPVKPPPEAVLYSLQGGSDGRNPPIAGLITDRSGALYGITQLGGTFSNPNCLHYGCGTVFKLTPPSVGQTKWSYNVLYRFTGGSEGDDTLVTLMVLIPQKL